MGLPAHRGGVGMPGTLPAQNVWNADAGARGTRRSGSNQVVARSVAAGAERSPAVPVEPGNARRGGCRRTKVRHCPSPRNPFPLPVRGVHHRCLLGLVVRGYRDTSRGGCRRGNRGSSGRDGRCSTRGAGGRAFVQLRVPMAAPREEVSRAVRTARTGAKDRGGRGATAGAAAPGPQARDSEAQGTSVSRTCANMVS